MHARTKEVRVLFCEGLGSRLESLGGRCHDIGGIGGGGVVGEFLILIPT